MYPRVIYEITEEDLKALLDAMQPVPMIMTHIGGGESQQDRANRAWKALGDKYGFDYMTVQPINGKENRFFSAVPKENEIQRTEREQKEAEQKRQQDIMTTQMEIAVLQQRLINLTK